MDTALDDFVSRFGKIDTANTDFGEAGTGFKAGSLAMGTEGIGKKVYDKDNAIGHSGVTVGGKEFKSGGKGMSASGIAGIVTEVAGQSQNIMGLISNAKGGQFNTDAESGGPGKAGGAIIQGAQQGMELGGTLGGFLGPVGKLVGMGVGAAGGGLVSTFAHKGAMKEFNNNQRDRNLQENRDETSQRRDDYRMSRGLASIAESKELIKRQNNITL